MNNAGIVRDRTLLKMDEADFDAVIAVHLKGTFNCARHAAPIMKDAGLRPHRQHHVVGRAARQLRPDQLRRGQGRHHGHDVRVGARARPYGITVNAVAPAGATRMTGRAVRAHGRGAAARGEPGAERAAGRVPRVGAGRPRERPDPRPHRLQLHALPAPEADRVDVARRRLDAAEVAEHFDKILGQHLQHVGMVMPSGLSQDTARK